MSNRLFILSNEVVVLDDILQMAPLEETHSVEADVHGHDGVLT
jgi:hypothetical protein